MPGDLVSYHDGDWVEAGSVRLPTDDAGSSLGDGLFETLRVDDGVACDVTAHLERLRSGLELIDLRIPETDAELRAAIQRVAAAAPRPIARLRLSVSAGSPSGEPTRLIEARSYRALAPAERAQGVAVQVERAVRVHSTDVLRRVKSLSWQRQALALRRARDAGAWEALLINEEGRVAEGSRTNVVARRGDRFVTPALAEGCLAGTVRRRLLEQRVVDEGRIEVDELPAVEELLLTNSLVGVVSVRCVDTTEIPVGDGAARLEAILASAWDRP